MATLVQNSGHLESGAPSSTSHKREKVKGRKGNSSDHSVQNASTSLSSPVSRKAGDNAVGTPGTSNPKATGSASGAAAAASPHSTSHSCCFCWYRCFRCKCLTSKSQEDGEAAKSREVSSNKASCNIDQENLPSVEEIRCWGESFDRLMRSPAGRAVFREFLKCEYSEENILFWLACEDLKKETNPEVIEEKARLIYEDFISILSPKEVSLDSRVREIVNRNMVMPTSQTFDEAQLQIYTLMHRDSYPRFVNSSFYKKLAQLNCSSRKESSA